VFSLVTQPNKDPHQQHCTASCISANIAVCTGTYPARSTQDRTTALGGGALSEVNIDCHLGSCQRHTRTPTRWSCSCPSACSGEREHQDGGECAAPSHCSPQFSDMYPLYSGRPR